METLVDINDGVAPFPTVGDRVTDTEWSDVAEYGRVYKVDYPMYLVEWDDGSVSVEKVRY